MPELDVRLTCPECRHVSLATMPTNQCVFFYECPHCKKVLRPKPGDCCVYCSYGDKPCPDRSRAKLRPGIAKAANLEARRLDD